MQDKDKPFTSLLNKHMPKPKKPKKGRGSVGRDPEDQKFRDFFTGRGWNVNRTYGRAINPGSAHPSGRAADIDPTGKSDEEVGKLIEEGIKYGYRAYDERWPQPGAKSTGPNIHFERPPSGSKPSAFHPGKYGSRTVEYLQQLDAQRRGKGAPKKSEGEFTRLLKQHAPEAPTGEDEFTKLLKQHAPDQLEQPGVGDVAPVPEQRVAPPLTPGTVAPGGQKFQGAIKSNGLVPENAPGDAQDVSVAKPTPPPGTGEVTDVQVGGDPNEIVGRFALDPLQEGADPIKQGKEDIVRKLNIHYDIPIEVGREWIDQYGIGTDPSKGPRRTLTAEEVAIEQKNRRNFALTSSDLDDLIARKDIHALVNAGAGDVLPSERYARLIGSGYGDDAKYSAMVEDLKAKEASLMAEKVQEETDRNLALLTSPPTYTEGGFKFKSLDDRSRAGRSGMDLLDEKARADINRAAQEQFRQIIKDYKTVDNYRASQALAQGELEAIRQQRAQMDATGWAIDTPIGKVRLSGVSQFTVPLQAVSNIAQSASQMTTDLISTIPILQEGLGIPSADDVVQMLLTGEYKNSPAYKRLLYQGAQTAQKWVEDNSYNDPLLNTSMWLNDAPKAITQVLAQTALSIATGGAAASTALGASQGIVEQYKESLGGPGEEDDATATERRARVFIAAVAAVPEFFVQRSFLKAGGFLKESKLFSKFLDNSAKQLYSKFAGEFGEVEAKELTRAALNGMTKRYTEMAKQVLKAAGPVAEGTVYEPIQETLESKINNAAAYYMGDRSQTRWNKVQFLTEEDKRTMQVSAITGLVGGGTSVALGRVGASRNKIVIDGKEYDTPKTAQPLLQQALAKYDSALETWKNAKDLFESGRKQKTQAERREYRQAARKAYELGVSEFMEADQMYQGAQNVTTGVEQGRATPLQPLMTEDVLARERAPRPSPAGTPTDQAIADMTAATQALAAPETAAAPTTAAPETGAEPVTGAVAIPEAATQLETAAAPGAVTETAPQEVGVGTVVQSPKGEARIVADKGRTWQIEYNPRVNKQGETVYQSTINVKKTDVSPLETAEAQPGVSVPSSGVTPQAEVKVAPYEPKKTVTPQTELRVAPYLQPGPATTVKGKTVAQPLKRAFTSPQQQAEYNRSRDYLERKLSEAGFSLNPADLEAEHSGLYAATMSPVTYRNKVNAFVNSLDRAAPPDAEFQSMQGKLQRRPLTTEEQGKYHELTQKVRDYMEERRRKLKEGFDSDAVMKDLFHFTQGAARVTQNVRPVRDRNGNDMYVGDRVQFGWDDREGIITAVRGSSITVQVDRIGTRTLDPDEQYESDPYADEASKIGGGMAVPVNVEQAITQYFETRFPGLVEEIPVTVEPFTKIFQEHVIGPARQLAETSSALTYRPPYTVTSMLNPEFQKYRMRDPATGQFRPIARDALTSTAFAKAKPLEKEFINQVLDSPAFKDRKKFPFHEFEVALSQELLPLNVVFSSSHDNYGHGHIGGVYDSYTSHVYVVSGLQDLTRLQHGYQAHWDTLFTQQVAAVKYVVKEVQDELGRPIYLVVPGNIEALDVEYPERLRKTYEEKPEAVHLTNRNLHELSVFTTDKQGDAETYADVLTNARYRNKGLFGHTRVWIKDKTASVVEFQGEGLQRFTYPYPGGTRAPHAKYKFDKGRDTWNPQPAVSSAVEMLWNHFRYLKDEGDDTYPGMSGLIDRAERFKKAIEQVQHGDGSLAMQRANSYMREVAKDLTVKVKNGLIGVERDLEALKKAPVDTKELKAEKEQKTKELKKQKKRLQDAYTAALQISNLRHAAYELVLTNLEDQVTRKEKEAESRKTQAEDPMVIQVLEESHARIESEIANVRRAWEEGYEELQHVADTIVETENEAYTYISTNNLRDRTVTTVRNPNTADVQWAVIERAELNDLDSTRDERLGTWPASMPEQIVRNVVNDLGVTDNTNWYYELKAAVAAQFAPGPWVEDVLHRGGTMETPAALYPVVQEYIRNNSSGGGASVSSLQRDIKHLKDSFDSKDFKTYERYERQIHNLWSEFQEKLPVWGKQFVYHQTNFAQRMIREEIKRAAQRGLTHLRIPAGETGSLGEGHLDKYRIADSTQFDVSTAGWEPVSSIQNNRPTPGATIRSNGTNYDVLDVDADGFTGVPPHLVYKANATETVQSFSSEDVPGDTDARIELAKRALEENGYTVLQEPGPSRSQFVAIHESVRDSVTRFNHAPPGVVDYAVLRTKFHDPGHVTVFERFVEAAEWFQKERPDAKMVLDEVGNRWYETAITAEDATMPVALFKANIVEQQLDDRDRFAVMEEFNDEFFNAVDSTLDDNGAIKLNSAAAELIRRMESQSKIDGGVDPFVPLFAAAFAREGEVEVYQERLQGILDEMTAAGYPEESKKGVQKLLDQINELDNGIGVLYVKDWALPHEKIHEARYMNAAMEASIQNYYKDFNKTFRAAKTDDGKNTVNEKAYAKYFKKVYFNNRSINDLSREERAILHEETFAFISDGDYEQLGLTDSEAARFIEEDMLAYIEQNGPDILDDLEIWTNEKTAQLGVTAKLRSGLKATEELEKAGISVQSATRGTGGGPRVSGQGTETGTAEGAVPARAKDRQVPKTISERTTLNEEDLTPMARQLETLPREEAAKQAGDWLHNEGFERAYPQVFDLPPSAQSTAKRMAVIEHIDGQIEMNYIAGDIGRAKEWYGKLVALTNAISPDYTEYGRAIGQLARWSDLDPSSIVGHTQQKMAKSGKANDLGLKQQQELRDQAQTIADLENQIQKLMAKKNGTPREKAVDALRPAAKSAISKLKGTFGSLKKIDFGDLDTALDLLTKIRSNRPWAAKNLTVDQREALVPKLYKDGYSYADISRITGLLGTQVTKLVKKAGVKKPVKPKKPFPVASLKMAAADKIRKLGVTESAASWINRNEDNIDDWSKILSSATGAEDLKQRVETQFKEASRPEKIKEASTTDMKDYLQLQIDLVDQGANLANQQVQRAVQAARTNPEAAKKALEDYVATERTEVLKEWKTYLTQENPTYAEDPYFRDFVWNELVDLRKDKPDVPPALDRAVTAGVYTIFNTGQNFSSFNKLYKKEASKVIKEATDMTKVKTTGGTWVKIPRTAKEHPDFTQNAGRVRSLSASTWCTSRGMETTYIQKGDFWIYQEDGTTQLALRFDGDNVAEIQGRMNNGKIPVEYVDQVTQLQESGEVNFGASANRQIEKAKDQIVQSQKIKEWMAQEGITDPSGKVEKAETLNAAKYEYISEHMTNGMEMAILDNAHPDDLKTAERNLKQDRGWLIDQGKITAESFDAQDEDYDRLLAKEVWDDLKRAGNEFVMETMMEDMGVEDWGAFMEKHGPKKPEITKSAYSAMVNADSLSQAQGIYVFNTELEGWLKENAKYLTSKMKADLTTISKLGKPDVAAKWFGEIKRKVDILKRFETMTEAEQVETLGLRKIPRKDKYIFPHRVSISKEGIIGNPKMNQGNPDHPMLGMPLGKLLDKIEVFEKSVSINIEMPNLKRAERNIAFDGVSAAAPKLEIIGANLLVGATQLKNVPKKLRVVGGSIQLHGEKLKKGPVTFPKLEVHGNVKYNEPGVIVSSHQEEKSYTRPDGTEYKYTINVMDWNKLDGTVRGQFDHVRLGKITPKQALLMRAEDNIEGGDDFLDYANEFVDGEEDFKDTVEKGREQFVTIPLGETTEEDEKENDAVVYVFAKQFELLEERYGKEVADKANYGHGIMGPDEDGNIEVGTKVYGYGYITTQVNVNDPGNTLEHDESKLEFDQDDETYEDVIGFPDIDSAKKYLTTGFDYELSLNDDSPDPADVTEIARDYSERLIDALTDDARAELSTEQMQIETDRFHDELIRHIEEGDHETKDEWPDLLMRVDSDQPLSDFDPATREALIDLGTFKFLEGRMAGGQSFADWSASIRNELTAGNVDPSRLDGYYKSLYRAALAKVKSDHKAIELDRVKERFGITDDTEARQKLLELKEAQVQKQKILGDAARAVKPGKDKRTAIQIAIDDEIEAYGPKKFTRDDILGVKDRNKFFSDRAGKMTPAQISELYVEAVNIYIDATSSLRDAQAQLKADKEARGPGLSPALTKEEQIQINKDLDDKRKEKARQGHDLRKLIDHIVGRPEGRRERLGDWYKRINRSGEALLTATVKTAAHNVIAQRGTKLLNTLETAVELGFAKAEAAMGVNLFAETGLDVPATTRFRDIAKQELKSSSFPGAREAIKDMWNGEADVLAALQTVVAYKQRVVEGILGHNPDLYDKMIGQYSYGEDVAAARPLDESYGMGSKTVERFVRGVEKYVHYGTVLNRVQEKHFRFATFLATVSADLKGNGIDLDAVVKAGETAKIPRHLLDRAVQRALDDTFGHDFPTDSTLGRMTKAASDTASWVPFIVNPLLFRRFFYNSNKFMLEHSPLVLAKTVTKAGFSRRDAAKFTTGLGMFVFALQLLRAFGSDDDDPTVLKVPTPWGPQNLRVSAFNPISTFLVAANFYNRVSKGKTLMKTGDEALQMFGIDARYPNLALDWWKSIIHLGSSDSDKYLKLGEQTTILGARGLAAFLRPLATVKDIVAQFDEMEGAVREPMGQTFRTEFGKTVPFISTRNIPGLQAPPLPREDVMTQKPLTKKSPLLDQLGLTFINDNQIGAKFSPAEEYLDQAAQDERANRPKKFKDPKQRQSSAVAAQLFQAIDKGNNVLEPAKAYRKRGILSQPQLEDILEANRFKSTIERKAKYAPIQKVVEAWWLANPEERKILERVLKIKRADQIYSGSFTPVEKEAVESVIPRPVSP